MKAVTSEKAYSAVSYSVKKILREEKSLPENVFQCSLKNYLFITFDELLIPLCFNNLRRTTAVTETEEGVRVISSSNRRLSPAQRAQLGANEIEGVGIGHAEVTGINAAKAAGLTPKGTAESRPICTSCASALKDEGVKALSPLK